MTVPPPTLPSRPSAGPGLDSFPQEMDEILTSWSIDNTAGEVALAPGHEGRRRRLLPGQRGLAEPFRTRGDGWAAEPDGPAERSRPGQPPWTARTAHRRTNASTHLPSCERVGHNTLASSTLTGSLVPRRRGSPKTSCRNSKREAQDKRETHAFPAAGNVET